jgi:hypothetical protein
MKGRVSSQVKHPEDGGTDEGMRGMSDIILSE